MNEKLQELFFELSLKLMKNEEAEAEAVQGYNEQLAVIAKLRDALEEVNDVEILPFLDKLEAATKEKISDELNHGESLYAEYVEMTGIQPATT